MDLLTYELGDCQRRFDLVAREVQRHCELEDAQDWRLQHVCEEKFVVCLRPSQQPDREVSRRRPRFSRVVSQ